MGWDEGREGGSETKRSDKRNDGTKYEVLR